MSDSVPATSSTATSPNDARFVWWRDSLPLLVAVFASLLCVRVMSGMFVPDMVNFLREAPGSGEPSPEFHVISPAYPSILAAIRCFVPTHARMFTLVVLQHIAIVGAVWCVLRIGHALLRPRLGLLCSTLVALYLPYHFYAQTAQQEAFFVLFACAAALYAVRTFDGRSSRAALWAGACAGLAIAQRSLGLAVIASILAALLIGRVHRRWRSIGLVLAGYAVVVAAFCGKNLVQHGNAHLVNGVGLHMFGRIAMVDKWLPETPESAELQRLARKAGHDDVLFQNAGWRLQWALQVEGMDPWAADALLRTVSVQALTHRPWEALDETLESMAQMVQWHDPSGHVIWGGLRPEGFDQHLDITRQGWSEGDSAELRDRMMAQFPPYRGERRGAILGIDPYDLLEDWGAATQVWRGSWVMIAMLLCGFYGLIRRDAAIVLFAALAASQLVGAALGDQPYERYWDPSVAFFIPMLLFSAHAVILQRREKRAAASADSTAPDEPHAAASAKASPVSDDL